MKSDFGKKFKNPQNQFIGYSIASEFDIFHKLEFDMFMFITHILKKRHLCVIFMKN